VLDEDDKPLFQTKKCQTFFYNNMNPVLMGHDISLQKHHLESALSLLHVSWSWMLKHDHLMHVYRGCFHWQDILVLEPQQRGEGKGSQGLVELVMWWPGC